MGALFAVAFSSGSFIFNNISFAQKATTPSSTDNSFDSSSIPTTTTTNTTTTASNGAQNQPAADESNKMVQFNHYENSEIGISLKYPSNFLIDESNSNNTLRQISFYPTNSAPISSIPEQYILWMDVFVQNQGNQQQQHPLLSLSQRLSSSLSSSSQVSNPDLASYSLNLANSIQQANKDVSIIGSYPNVTLSGYPAYKLITKSFIGNTAIIDVLISAAVNNTIYSVDFQTNSSNYPNSISNTNKIIQSFKIMSPGSLASATTTTTMNPSSPPQPQLSSSSSSSLSQSSAPPASTSTSPNSPSSSSQQSENSKTKPSSSALIPSLSNILSDLQLNDIANNSTHLLKTLKNTVTNSMNDVLSNPQNALDNSIKGTTSLIPTTPSELTSLPSTALKKACGLPFVSGVCSEIGKSVINKDQNPNLEKSVDNGSANNTSSNNSISNNAAAVNRGNEGIGNGTIAGANVNREAGIGNGESGINNGGISDNNKRNSLITSLESLFSANTNNNTNQSSLSSNSSALGSGLSFLEKLILHLTPSTLISKTPNTTSSVPIISSLNSSMLAATTDMANQSNSTFANPSSSSSSSPAPSSQQQSPSTYIPPPIH
ncbi:MAG: hypothetical protein ACTHLL_01840 [Candidatus Nitrosocosmicus sp.]